MVNGDGDGEMSRERKLPSMPLSQDKAHTMLGVFTEITVSNSDNDLHLVRVMSGRLMVGCRTFRKWRYGGRCYFGCSFFLFSSRYSFTSLDLNPVQMASARVITTAGDKSSGGEVSRCAGSAEWLPYSTNRLWDLWVRTFAYAEQLFDCFPSFAFLLLYGFMQPRGSAPKEGDNVMARLHVTCPGPGNTRFI